MSETQSPPVKTPEEHDRELVNRAMADSVFFQQNHPAVSRALQRTRDRVAAQREAERLERTNTEAKGRFESAQRTRADEDKARFQQAAEARGESLAKATDRLARNRRSW